MIKDLLLPMTATAGDDAAFAAAVALASRLQAHLAVLEVVDLPVPIANPWELSASAGMLALYAELRETGKRNAAALRTRLEREDISWEVRLEETLHQDPGRLASHHARYSDLSLVAAPGASGARAAHACFEALLLASGRPVLAIPDQRDAQVTDGHVVVAWQPSMEATRAIHDALALMSAATSVDVLQVIEKPAPRETAERTDPSIALHLARHGLQVNLVSRPCEDDSVARTLLRHATESGARLLVAGGYGHSRAREWWLGGTTRELLQTAHLPVFFAH